MGEPLIEGSVAPRRRGGKILFVGSIVAQVSALLRYVALARLLGPEQLGLAATIVVTGSFFDLISETGSDRFLIQDRDGDFPEVQKLVQLVYASRGAMIALALVIFSIPLARLYGEPRLAIGLAVFGLSPLILGFLHLDYRRQQRESDFRAEGLVMVAGETASLLVTVAAAWLTRNFTAILYGLIARAAVMTMVSHLRAQRPYALRYSRIYWPRLARFGAPLMLTGLMLFIGSQGDRITVVKLLGFKALGHYSAMLLLIYYPTAMILRFVHSLGIPVIAATRDNPSERDFAIDRLGGQTFLLAVSMCVGFAIVAPIMVPILYGARYAQGVLIIGMIGVLQTTRFLTVWPTTAALSLGWTRTVMINNLVRLLAYPAAFAGVMWIGGMAGVVAGFIAGELASIGAAIALVNHDLGRAKSHGFGRLGLFALVAGAVIGCDLAVERHDTWVGLACICGGSLLLAWTVRREAGAVRTALTLGRPFIFRLRSLVR